MKKRGRPERAASDPKRWLCLLFLTMQQQHDAAVQAMFPRHRWNAWKSGDVSARARIKYILQNRGGAINWDEPFYSDDSEGEGGSTFLPSEEEYLEEDEKEEREQPLPPPQQQQKQQPQYESDEDLFDAGESDSDLRVAPFLESFQREIHTIVHDYRQEVSDTFRHLKDDILDSQDRYSRKSRPVPLEKYTEEDEGLDVPKAMPKRRRKPVTEEKIEDDFIVGDTDEEEDHVMFRLKDERENKRKDAHGSLNWGVDEDTDASTGNLWANVEDPLKDKTTKKRRRRKSGKKKGKAPSSQRTASEESETELVEESSPKEVGEDLMDDGSRSAASLAPGDNPSLLNSQMWKSATVAMSVLAMAILMNIAFQILSKMLWGKTGKRA
eukprot:scaffold3069_cov215-Amphora_coffeaeformis.AAC.3